MSVVLPWLRIELRRRWRSLLVLALLIALAAGTVLTAVAGARRGASAIDRLLEVTLPATAAVLPNQPGFDWDAIRALPEVEAVATFPVTGFDIDGVPSEETGDFPYDAQAMHTLERPVVLVGRLADPGRADEAVVTTRFVDHFGLEVGDTVTVRLPKPETVEASFLTGDPYPQADGPTIPMRIVGVVRSPVFSDQVGESTGGLIPSAGLLAQYRANLLGHTESVYINALVRLRGGADALPAFRADLARASGRSDIDVWDLAAQVRAAQQVNAFESVSLLAFGLAALVAEVVLVGQAVVRYTAATVADLQVLRAIGMTPLQAVLVAIAGPGLAAVAGTSFGVVAAVAASRWMPVGAPALWEPDPGIDADWLVLGTGWVAFALTVVGGAAAVAWLAMAAGRSAASPRRSAVARAVAKAGLPVPLVIGTRFALEPGRGRSAVPVRAPILGALTGVLGVLAAFTFSAGVADAADTPSRFGRTYQLEGFFGLNGQDFRPAQPALSAIAADPDVLGVNDGLVAVAESRNTSVAMYTHDPVGAPVPTVLSTGRLPSTADKVALAATSARLIGAEVGSTVEFTGSTGLRRVTVTGIGFIPSGPHNDYDEGGWLTPAGFGAMFTGFKFHTAQIALRPGVDPAAVSSRLSQAAGAAIGIKSVPLTQPEPLPVVAQLRDVQVLPVLLGGFLALLAVGAVGHALATAVRRRWHEVAVLRALGMTRWQSRGIVVTHASVLAGIGLAFGIPLGLALGRTTWRVVADSTPLLYVPPVALAALVLIAPLALLIANLLAAPPGQRAARLRIGHVLRAE
jgi:FtsX-like permease family